MKKGKGQVGRNASRRNCRLLADGGYGIGTQGNSAEFLNVAIMTVIEKR